MGFDVACSACGTGRVVPLSDFSINVVDGRAHAGEQRFKAWACTNQPCGFVLRIDKGIVTYGHKAQRGER